ncbi:MAG: chemotaxis protein CheD [Paucibacter sp.]|nr:chemotaxis protein CheD [Roseateles sp.]
MSPGRSISIFLMPGEHFTGDAQHRISTLLGSCVSITLWHPTMRLGAMSHFLLPGTGTDHRRPRNARYGADALAMMIADLAARGCNACECEAKIFGGGAMFDLPSGKGQDIGRRNGEAARLMLREAGIRVVSESLFEAGHRRIVFSIKSGEVWVRHEQRVPTALPAVTRSRELPR